MQVVLYDPDLERLDLFHRLARSFFAFNKSTHGLWATENPDDALAEAELVIVQIEDNAVKKMLKGEKSTPKTAMTKALAKALANISPTAETLSLLDATIKLPVRKYRTMEWVPPLTEAERVAVPHQSLRWIHGEEYPFEIMAECETGALKEWLLNPASAKLAKG